MRSLTEMLLRVFERRPRPVPGRPALKVNDGLRLDSRLIDYFWPPAFLTGRRASWLGSGLLGIVVVAGILQVTGVFARLEASWSGMVADVSREEGLTIQNVSVYGRQLIKARDIMAALGVRRGELILNFDVDAARKRLQGLAWVQSVSVERRMPNRVVVLIVERRPMALWQVGGRILLVDQNGVTIAGQQNNVAAYPTLPLLVGDGAPAHATELLKLYTQDPVMARRVQAAILVSKRRWNLKFNNGIEVRLPETGLAEAWERLANLDRKDRLLERDLAFIDLRQSDRLVVRLNDGAERKLGSSGKNT